MSLQSVVEKIRAGKANFTAKVKETLTRSEAVKQHDDLAHEAEECAAILADTRYEKQQEFINKNIQMLQEAMQFILARDIKNLNRHDSLLKVCAIAAQIEAYKNIIERPEKVVKQYEEIKKLTEVEV